ncbi:MAG TPA: sulfite exporter TauE/SafE family protein [Polyangiaceae bacterium]|nr:sulfite exporter TauE/SafE family protein [Polyangiaceae bacterium]
MTAFEYALLFGAAALGGAVNAVAGGGTFLTFPALIFVGVPPVAANATSTVALWPGFVAATIAYRRELMSSRRWFVPLFLIGGVGGALGALLLLGTSNATFSELVPYLLLVAALVFTFGGRVNAWLGNIDLGRTGSRGVRALGGLLLLAITVYGGYFGGGMGMLLLATFALLGMTDIHRMNALKNALATLINWVAVITFLIGGVVAFRPGLVMIAAATIGGYAGAAVARRLDPAWVRRFVLVVAWSMTVYFFWRTKAA